MTSIISTMEEDGDGQAGSSDWTCYPDVMTAMLYQSRNDHGVRDGPNIGCWASWKKPKKSKSGWHEGSGVWQPSKHEEFPLIFISGNDELLQFSCKKNPRFVVHIKGQKASFFFWRGSRSSSIKLLVLIQQHFGKRHNLETRKKITDKLTS